MAYFPNGTAGEIFQNKWCSRCIHDVNDDCPVWLLHLIYNYKEPYKDILNILIKDDMYSPTCNLFHEATKEEYQPTPSQERERLMLEEWNRRVRENGHV